MILSRYNIRKGLLQKTFHSFIYFFYFLSASNMLSKLKYFNYSFSNFFSYVYQLHFFQLHDWWEFMDISDVGLSIFPEKQNIISCFSILIIYFLRFAVNSGRKIFHFLYNKKLSTHIDSNLFIIHNGLIYNNLLSLKFNNLLWAYLLNYSIFQNFFSFLIIQDLFCQKDITFLCKKYIKHHKSNLQRRCII